MKVGEVAKAVVAGVGAGCAAAGPLLADGTFSNGDFFTVVGAVAAVFGIVFVVPNAEKSG
jgi:hypothetical protein